MKTEKEKMLSGESYNPGDAELIARWHKAKKLTHIYNNTPSDDHKTINMILTELLGKKGDKIWIAQPFYCDYGENIFIGNNTEINMNCVFLDCNKISIGNNVLIAPSVQIYTVFHPISSKERFRDMASDEALINFANTLTSPVTIGDNVWIGGGSIILPGVTVGDNVTIGAGSVVTKSIDSNCLAFGNSCRTIKKLDNF